MNSRAILQLIDEINHWPKRHTSLILSQIIYKDNDEAKRVAILSFPHVAMFEIACAVELFGLPRPEFESWYQCEVVSFEHAPLETTAGLQLQAKAVKQLDDYDMLVVPSWPASQSNLPPLLAEQVLRCYQHGKRIVSFCSGSFLLAELGILEGRNATTHWRYAQQFQQRFPNLNYLDDVLYVYDGRSVVLLEVPLPLIWA